MSVIDERNTMVLSVCCCRLQAWNSPTENPVVGVQEKGKGVFALVSVVGCWFRWLGVVSDGRVLFLMVGCCF